MLKVGSMKLIEREDYENRLAAVMRTPDIKVLCGVRRAGKSKLLSETARRIGKSDEKANIIFIDLTLLKNEKLKEYHALNNFVTKHTKKSARNYLFIDEVQLCKDFELAINSLKVRHLPYRVKRISPFKRPFDALHRPPP